VHSVIMKKMNEARYFKVLEDNKVQCVLCPNNCKIADGAKGYCQVRVNRSGVLYSKVYNQYSSVAIDPIEKKPLNHFYPGQNILSLGSLGCNFRCKHCQNWEISQPFRLKDHRSLECLQPLQIRELTTKYGLSMVAFTYNEPLISIETVIDTSRVLKENGINVVLVTNGFINTPILNDLDGLIDAYSIDLKAFAAKKYKELSGVNAFETVKRNITRLNEGPAHIELVTNLVTGINDDLNQLKAAAKWISELNVNIPWHISSFRPMLDFKNRAPISAEFLDQVMEVAKGEGLNHVYGKYQDNTVCQNCKEMIIYRKGFSVYESNLDANTCSFCGHVVPYLVN